MQALTRILTVALVSLTALGAVACGGSGDKTESTAAPKQITGAGADARKQIAERTGSAEEKVTCPDGIKAEKGTTFTCSVSYGGQTSDLKVKVKVTDDQGTLDLKTQK